MHLQMRSFSPSPLLPLSPSSSGVECQKLAHVGERPKEQHARGDGLGTPQAHRDGLASCRTPLARCASPADSEDCSLRVYVVFQSFMQSTLVQQGPGAEPWDCLSTLRPYSHAACADLP